MPYALRTTRDVHGTLYTVTAPNGRPVLATYEHEAAAAAVEQLNAEHAARHGEPLFGRALFPTDDDRDRA